MTIIKYFLPFILLLLCSCDSSQSSQKEPSISAKNKLMLNLINELESIESDVDLLYAGVSDNTLQLTSDQENSGKTESEIYEKKLARIKFIFDGLIKNKEISLENQEYANKKIKALQKKNTKLIVMYTEIIEKQNKKENEKRAWGSIIF